MHSYFFEEIEQKDLKKQKENRKIFDEVDFLFQTTKFAGFEIKKIEDGYSLWSDDISFLFEDRWLNPFPAKFTVIYKDESKISFRDNEILEERDLNGSLKTSIDEYFIHLNVLTK